MNINIIAETEFRRQFKRLYKRYPSLKDDILTLQEELQKNPYTGADLGGGTYKVRVAIASKSKGKSGGARVITYVVEELENETKVHLLTIYDKSEIESISDSYIKALVNELGE